MIKMWWLNTNLSLPVICTCIIVVQSMEVSFWSELDGEGYSVNYTGTDDSPHCYQKLDSNSKVKSITTNACILFYPTATCSGESIFKVQNTTKNFTDRFLKIQSWILCTKEQLGFNVHISHSAANTTPVVQYQNLCKCVNIPYELFKEYIYVYTEGEDILFYEGLNCTGTYEWSYGGQIQARLAESPLSLQPFDRPYTCPALKGVLTDFTNFEQTKNQIITLSPIEAIPSKITTTMEQNRTQITFKSNHTITITTKELDYTKRLETCEIRRGLTLKTKLWEATWDQEKEFMENVVANHCKKRRATSRRTLMMHELLVFSKNISVVPGSFLHITASRGVVHKSLMYRLQFNITGILEYSNVAISAIELENSFPQSGLTFVRKLDDFTVLAKVNVTMDLSYPISTLYKTEIK